MISLSKVRLAVMIPLGLLVFACGYSQEEWDQKVRENENLRGQLAQQEQARRKCDADHADAENEIAELKKQLSERGVDLDNLNASLGQQKKALEEYAARTKQLDDLKKRFDLLKSKLQKLTAEYGLKVETRDNRMLIQLPGDVLFDSSKATLRKDGKDILGQVAEMIRNDAQLSAREFQVAGHTDAKPLHGGPFIDNWGLSAMRARTVVEFLTQAQPDGGGLNPAKWSAAGYAETDPVVPNDTDENRMKNRRVELVIQPDVEEMLNLGSLTK
jgi:chemotaxis protein MotB